MHTRWRITYRTHRVQSLLIENIDDNLCFEGVTEIWFTQNKEKVEEKSLCGPAHPLAEASQGRVYFDTSIVAAF